MVDKSEAQIALQKVLVFEGIAGGELASNIAQYVDLNQYLTFGFQVFPAYKQCIRLHGFGI